MGNSSLMGSSILTAMSSPALAPCASSAGFFIVPKGAPVLVDTSNVPAECHLRDEKKRPDLRPPRTLKYHSGDVQAGGAAYARRSMSGAQLFSTMRLRSFGLAFSTAT
jgi:hypothetical protein